MSKCCCCKAPIAEFFGTLLLVLVGCGSAVISLGGIGIMGVALSFGIILMAAAYAIGPVSGCHINPAVTIGMLSVGKISPLKALKYIIAQLLGAAVGAGILYVIVKNLNMPTMTGLATYDVAKNGLGQNGFAEASMLKASLCTAFVLEVVLTAIFLYVISGVTSAKAAPGFAGIAIGLTLAVLIMIGLPVTGASLNPARSFGPALWVAVLGGGTEAINQVWLFFVAPIIGAIVGCWLWKLTEPSAEACETEKK